jgi:hypothetical protein
VQEKRWSVLAGTAVAFAVATLVALFFRHSILADYIAQFHAAQVLKNPSPNLGTLLRAWISPGSSWLQFVPTALGVAWFAWYLRRRRWQWSPGMPLLLVVSLATTSYGWVFDHVTLLPAVVQEALKPGWSRAVIVVYLLVNVVLVLSITLHATGMAYAWVAPAWVAVYWLAASVRRGSR